MSRGAWIGLVVLATVVVVVQLPGAHATAWHFFELSVDLLLDRGPEGDRSGLRLYGDHPELQYGPLSILVAVPFVLLGDGPGEAAVIVVAMALGLGAVWLVLDILRAAWGGLDDATAGMLGVVGTVVVVTWGDVAVRTAHLDDAIALIAILLGLRWVVRDAGTAATLAFAVAAAAKPWAVVFVPLAALPGGPARLLRPVIAASLAVATWVPFILAEPDTLDTSDFGIENDPTSLLRALGVDAATTPGWVRPVQLVGGLILVGIVVGVGRWPAAMLAGVSWRLLFDPGAHRYYTIGFVLGALLVESRLRPGRAPWWTVAGALTLEVTAIPDIPVGPGQGVRLATIVVAFVAVTMMRPAPVPGCRSGTFAPMDPQ